MAKFMLSFLIICLSICLYGQTKKADVVPPALSSISVADLKNDMNSLSSAHFKGRSAGTLDELKAAQWLADKFRQIGLLPAGDDGTYMQYFTMWRNRVAANTQISINNQPLLLWDAVAVAQMANKNINAPILYLGNAASLDLANIDVKGKVVALEADPAGINLDISLPTWRYNRYIFNKYGTLLISKGAEAIIFIADDYAEKSWADAVENFKRGSYDINGGPVATVTATVPVLWVHGSLKPLLQQNAPQLNASIVIEKFDYPSVNIIGTIPGTGKQMAKEYLLYSGHTDAHGIRDVIKGDSIFYGADDNASVDVAMLAIARAFKKNPGKRSVVFVIHGAEERGLLGSRWYASHPTVPQGSIVAVINGDMIGRNSPDSAALLGMQPPHRNSMQLVGMALDANKEGPAFKLDTLWDKVTHVEGWYFRSDHLPYARAGIPALMYSTLLHPDYHTPQDNADNINFTKLQKMTEWMYRTGWKVANAPQRPEVEPGF